MKHLHLNPAPGATRGFSVMELLVVLAIVGIVAAIALPMAQPAMSLYEIGGQAHAVAYDVSLAKMQAASGFTQSRLYVDLSGNRYHLESWNQTTSIWTTQGGITQLAPGMGFGYGALSAPPPDTQGTIGQASACTDKCAGCSGAALIANTSCVLFNSRGTPIDATGQLPDGRSFQTPAQMMMLLMQDPQVRGCITTCGIPTCRRSRRWWTWSRMAGRFRRWCRRARPAWCSFWIAARGKPSSAWRSGPYRRAMFRASGIRPRSRSR